MRLASAIAAANSFLSVRVEGRVESGLAVAGIFSGGLFICASFAAFVSLIIRSVSVAVMEPGGDLVVMGIVFREWLGGTFRFATAFSTTKPLSSESVLTVNVLGSLRCVVNVNRRMSRAQRAMIAPCNG